MSLVSSDCCSVRPNYCASDGSRAGSQEMKLQHLLPIFFFLFGTPSSLVCFKPFFPFFFINSKAEEWVGRCDVKPLKGNAPFSRATRKGSTLVRLAARALAMISAIPRTVSSMHHASIVAQPAHFHTVLMSSFLCCTHVVSAAIQTNWPWYIHRTILQDKVRLA